MELAVDRWLLAEAVFDVTNQAVDELRRLGALRRQLSRSLFRDVTLTLRNDDLCFELVSRSTRIAQEAPKIEQIPSTGALRDIRRNAYRGSLHLRRQAE